MPGAQWSISGLGDSIVLVVGDNGVFQCGCMNKANVHRVVLALVDARTQCGVAATLPPVNASNASPA